jgi:hypothetical protein
MCEAVAARPACSEKLELPGARGRHRNEHKTAFPGAAIDAVEHEQVKVHVEIQRTAEALYQGHRTGRRAPQLSSRQDVI